MTSQGQLMVRTRQSICPRDGEPARQHGPAQNQTQEWRRPGTEVAQEWRRPGTEVAQEWRRTGTVNPAQHPSTASGTASGTANIGGASRRVGRSFRGPGAMLGGGQSQAVELGHVGGATFVPARPGQRA
ncbi:hypothetical protein GCM10022224_019840 [Nonomuraea antimicrobica]|uniref:Uncharacterized protein n=1 Tax=Nonomuraea antimicrobica TaxID=561173 RepID=A0ABP7BDR5_9ACTN